MASTSAFIVSPRLTSQANGLVARCLSPTSSSAQQGINFSSSNSLRNHPKRRSLTTICQASSVAAPPVEETKEFSLPTWAEFELGKAPVYWKTMNGLPPTSGGDLTLFYNPSASKLAPNDEYGIAFNGGFNQPIMCSGEPRVMRRKERGEADQPIYTIKTRAPKHAVSIIFSFTNGVDWDGPYKLQFQVLKAWRNKPLSFFNEMPPRRAPRSDASDDQGTAVEAIAQIATLLATVVTRLEAIEEHIFAGDGGGGPIPEIPVQHPPPPPPPVDDQEKWMKIVERFQKLRPPEFQGGDSDPVAANQWKEDTQRILELMGVTSVQMHRLASFSLRGEAGSWYQSDFSAEERTTLSWGEFTRRFDLHFISSAARAGKEMELLELEQGSSSVAAYAAKFRALSRFAGDWVRTEERKARMFERGLQQKIREAVMTQRLQTLGLAIDAAEACELALSCGRKTRDPVSKTPAQPAQSEQPKGKRQFPAAGQGVPQQGAGQFRKLTCFNCGKPGHKTAVCRQPGGGAFRGTGQQQQQGQQQFPDQPQPLQIEAPVQPPRPAGRAFAVEGTSQGVPFGATAPATTTPAADPYAASGSTFQLPNYMRKDKEKLIGFGKRIE